VGAWTALAIWLIRGDAVSIQPDAVPQPHARTIADVETELALAGQIRAYERALFARAWPSRIVDNLCDERPDYVREQNSLLDEWAYWRDVNV